MELLTNITQTPVQGLTPAEKLGLKTRTGPAKSEPSKHPVYDEFTPEEPRVPTGMYYPGRDEEGNPKVYVDAIKAPDAPNAAEALSPTEDAKNAEKADAPEASQNPDTPSTPEGPENAKEPDAPKPRKAADSDKEKKCVGDTDKVDAEIRKLKKKKQELEKQLRQAKDDPEKQEQIQRRLDQVNEELRRKDNDTYRRQHSCFTEV